MADTKLNLKRYPFALGTKMVFAQPSVPPDWTLDASDNDRFLRVVSGAGAGIGGPDNVDLDPTAPAHNHPIPHYHSTYHTHTSGNHTHTYPNGRTQGMATGGGVEDSADYRLRTNTFPFPWKNRTDGYHIRVEATGGGGYDEGHHDHVVSNVPYVNRTTTSMVTPSGVPSSTSGVSGQPSSTVNMNHAHNMNSDFRPRYKDIIVGELTG